MKTAQTGTDSNKPKIRDAAKHAKNPPIPSPIVYLTCIFSLINQRILTDKFLSFISLINLIEQVYIFLVRPRIEPCKF